MYSPKNVDQDPGIESGDSSPDPFYEDAALYWEKIPATIDGMLGGFGFISTTDILGSRNFLQQMFNMPNPPGKKYALDCGAGIGRITKALLAPIYDKVDLVEQNAAFLEKATTFVRHKSKIGELYPVGLQNFTPDKKYDIIWCQWVLGHLKDDHFVDFLIRCKKGLTQNGLIVVKDNITSSGQVETDEGDSSVTRPPQLLRALFAAAELTILKEVDQDNFPKGIYGVKMFALKPKQIEENSICSENVMLQQNII